MCYVPINILRKLSIFQDQHKSFTIHTCEVCPLARQTRFPFLHNVNRTTACFELLHVDVWGHINGKLLMA